MQMLHVFRNTPHGREELLQTAQFCKTMQASPVVYIPEFTKFLLYLDNDVVQVDLDKTFLRSPGTAREHVEEIMAEMDVDNWRFFVPRHFSTPSLPDVPVGFHFMGCPHTIADLRSKAGAGYIGPRIRRILASAAFPLLLFSPVFKPFTRIAVMFGGKANAATALRLAVRLHRLSGLPISMYTAEEGRRSRKYYEKLLSKNALTGVFAQSVSDWQIFPRKEFVENLYRIPHDALVVMGAYGHGTIRQLLMGSTVEIIQAHLPNNLLIAGPHYRGLA